MLKIKKITPMFNRIVTTMRKYAVDETINGVINASKLAGSLKEYQEVLAVGTTVKGINVGDLVCINPKRYEVKKYNEGSLNDGVLQENKSLGYRFNTIVIDDRDCLLLFDSDIDYIVNEYEDVEEPEQRIIVPGKNIIV